MRIKPQCKKRIWNLKGVAFKPEKTGLWFDPERAGEKLRTTYKSCNITSN